MGKPGNTGIKRIIKASGYSMKGLAAAFQNEAAFRQELALVIVLTPVAIWLGASNLERAVMIAVLLLVIIAELLNTAIEVAIDRIGAEQHELSGRAKDIASAAVLVSLINVVVVWGFICANRFIE